MFFVISQRCQQNGKVGVLKFLSLGQVHVRRPPRGVRLGVPHHHQRAVGRQGLGVSRLDVQLAEEAIFLVAGGERHCQPTLDKAICLIIGIDVWILLSKTDTDTQYLSNSTKPTKIMPTFPSLGRLLQGGETHSKPGHVHLVRKKMST